MRLPYASELKKKLQALCRGTSRLFKSNRWIYCFSLASPNRHDRDTSQFPAFLLPVLHYCLLLFLIMHSGPVFFKVGHSNFMIEL